MVAIYIAWAFLWWLIWRVTTIKWYVTCLCGSSGATLEGRPGHAPAWHDVWPRLHCPHPHCSNLYILVKEYIFKEMFVLPAAENISAYNDLVANHIRSRVSEHNNARQKILLFWMALFFGCVWLFVVLLRTDQTLCIFFCIHPGIIVMFEATKAIIYGVFRINRSNTLINTANTITPHLLKCVWMLSHACPVCNMHTFIQNKIIHSSTCILYTSHTLQQSTPPPSYAPQESTPPPSYVSLM
jgi:uncharacterized membrane protein